MATMARAAIHEEVKVPRLAGARVAAAEAAVAMAGEVAVVMADEVAVVMADAAPVEAAPAAGVVAEVARRKSEIRRRFQFETETPKHRIPRFGFRVSSEHLGARLGPASERSIYGSRRGDPRDQRFLPASRSVGHSAA
jgi:hypothetical protein